MRNEPQERTNDEHLSILPDISLNELEKMREKLDEMSYIKFIYTNARSLIPKLQSVYDLFEELDLSFALITETWMKTGRRTNEACDEIRNGQGLQIVYKNRDQCKTGSETGGGVAIIFDPRKISLKRYDLKKSAYEVVCATGKIKNEKRKVAIINVYIPPNENSWKVKGALNYVKYAINKIKTELKSPQIIVSGDFNRHQIVREMTEYPDLEEIITDNTRQNALLDRTFTNLDVVSKNTLHPLEDITGTRFSDHRVVLVSAQHQPRPAQRKRNFCFRKYTKSGAEAFGSDLLRIDWVKTYGNDVDNPDAMTNKLTAILESLLNKHFKTVRKTYTEDDAPWISQRCKDMISTRKRYYKKHQRTGAWKLLKKNTAKQVKNEKRAYFEKEVEKLTTFNSHTLPYGAVANLKTHDRPKFWNVRDLDPDATEEELSESLADFFSNISKEFTPLAPMDIPKTYSKPMPRILEYEVSARLKSCKKPKSMVYGDLFPELITKYHDLLALPLTPIFNAVKDQYIWPKLWKRETTTVIPKSESATTFGECRNLS